MKRKTKQRIVSFVTVVALMMNVLPIGELSNGISSLFSIAASAVEITNAGEQDSLQDDNDDNIDPVFSLNSSGETPYSPTYNSTVYEDTNNTNISFVTDHYNITFADERFFVDYCYHYNHTPGFAVTHKKDVLELPFTNTSVNRGVLPAEYEGLGKEDVPFNGTVKCGVTLQAHRAFFSYVTDSAKLLDLNGSNTQISFVRLSGVGDGECNPILADVVEHESGASSEWKLTLAASTSNSYSGVIGKLNDNASVKINYINNSSVDIVSNAPATEGNVPDVGTICGIMGSGASLELTYAASADYSVTSTNGNAGGLVGTIGASSTLTVKSLPDDVTPTIEAVNGYAGGLVGSLLSSVNIVNSTSSTISAKGTVKGKLGAGGLFGYYNNSLSSFDFSKYSNTANVGGVGGNGFCGGYFGVFENDASNLTFNTNINVGSSNSGGTSYGGIAGKITTVNLSDTLTLSSFRSDVTANATFPAFGGVFGVVDSAAYINVSDVTVNATNPSNTTSFGGIIGATSDSYGVFVNLGNFKLTASSFVGGGVVGTFNNGVLRLSGTTDMSEGSPADNENCGQLIGVNNNVLVYSLGTGSDSSPTAFTSGWKYLRSGSDTADDLGTWGEVVRSIDDSSSSGLIYFNSSSTDHTVTLAGVTAVNNKYIIDSQNDFIKIALNIQLNNKDDDYDCLVFTSESADKEDLLGGNISLTNDISLAGTGITGLMRDGGSLDTLGTFTGTFDGIKGTDQTYKITLATGETYGLTSAGGAVSETTTGAGQIYRHKHTGLFSVLAGTVSNLTLDGAINVRNRVDGMNIGGVASRNGGNGNVTLKNVTVNETISYHEQTNVSGTEAAGKNIGGLIGFVGTDGTINIGVDGTCTVGKGDSINPDLKLSGHHESWNVYGGAIGKVTAGTFTINVGTVNDNDKKLSMKMVTDISGITDVASNSDCGGLIGHIISAGSYANRTVNINNLDFEDCTISNAATTNGGGFLGYAWLNATTNIKGVVVKGTSNINNTYGSSSTVGAPNVGVMCYKATGKWVVDSLAVTNMSMSNGGGTTLGMLVNKAFDGSDGLYLDVLKNGYTLTKKSGNTGITLPNTLGVYDELAAYSALDVVKGTHSVTSGDKTITHGAGVVSINMNAGRHNPDADPADSYTEAKISVTGTYQNQLTSASSDSLGNTAYANENTRYYYNLDVLGNTDAGQNILLWSVNKYAASNINGLFVSSVSNNTLSGAANMTGLSFYPIEGKENYTISGLTLTMDYSGAYAAESVFGTYNATDGYIRDPAEANQHYLMHSGLFLSLSNAKTLTISDANTLKGDFLEFSGVSGVLISGTSNGSIKSSSGSTLVLDGIVAKTTANTAYDDGYLLVNNITRINSIDSNDDITVKLEGISTTNTYTSGATVAKSLLGAASGNNLNIEFTKIKLDSRKSGTLNSDSALNTAYGTTSSIFTDSTLLASINTDDKAQLKYYYTIEEDWGNGTRWVTYGKEVTDSVEYRDNNVSLENKYDGSEYYTHPTTSQSSSPYSFSLGFLPYVAVPFTAAQTNALYYRELKVNVSAEGLTKGCGTYNDPYVITDGKQLVAVSRFISTGSTNELSKVNLPKAKANYDSIGENTSGARWCTDKTGLGYHLLFTPNSVGTGYENGSITWTAQNVQYYLANAYYKIGDNIELSGDSSTGFVGLGGTSANTAFRGVIVGDKNQDGTPRYSITNNSANPFVNVSNGCVIKDVNVFVNAGTITLTQTTAAYNDAYFGYNYLCQYYGGIIGEIMGGDNIIDNSYVKYSYTDSSNVAHSTSILLTDDNNTTKYGTIIPVGGYVGVVVFGGLIFKNMNATNTTVSNTGLNVTYPYKAGVYKVTFTNNPNEGDSFTIAGITYTVAAGDTKTPTGIASKYKTLFNNDSSANYTANSNNGVLTLTEKKGKYGTGVPVVSTTSTTTTITAAMSTDPNSGNLAADTTEAYAAIYVNPIVGRVINGYAVNETETNAEKGTTGRFSVTENNTYHDDANSGAGTARTGNVHTLKNGKKHYTIADINKSETNKLSFGIAGNNNSVTNIVPADASTDGTINIPNAQAFFILSLITQSCAGTAQTANGQYNTSLSYGIYSTKEYGESSNTDHVYGMSHNADYSDIGKATSDTDYGYASADTAAKTAVPYIIRWYTAANSNNYPARCVTSTKGYYDINLTGKTAYSTSTDLQGNPIPLESYTYVLPDSFRGLGSVGNYDSINAGTNRNITVDTDGYKKRATNPFCMKIDTFTGNSCTIDADIYLNKYKSDNYFNVMHKGSNQSLKDNTTSFAPNTQNNNHGIGLFDSIIIKDTESSLSDFVLTGSVKTEIYNNTYQTTKSNQIIIGIDNANIWLSVGGVVGWATNATCLKFDKIILNNLKINGSSHVGGLLGFSGLSSVSLKTIISECCANNIMVKMSSASKNDSSKAPRQSRNAIGAFVGKAYECPVVIYGTSLCENNTNLENYSEVKIGSFDFGDDSLQYHVSTGGLVGFAGHGCLVYDMKASSYGSTVTIGNSNVRFSGGIVGGMQSVTDKFKPDSGKEEEQREEIECKAFFKNCTVENLDIAGEYAGGFYGGKWDSAWTAYSITFDNCKVLGKSTNAKNSISAAYISWTRGSGEGSELPCAGGFVGRGLVKTSAATNDSNILIKDSLVSNYEITATGNNTEATKGVAGGFIGFCSSNANNSTITCYIHDSSVENCVIGATGTYSYGGGAIGWVNPKNANYVNKMLGYNIKLDNVTSNNDSNMGAWVGFLNSNDSTTSIQFAGIAVYGNGFTKNVGNGRTLGTASFVFADYTGASKNFVTTTTTSSSVAKQVGDEDSVTETFTNNSAAKTVTRVVTTVTVGDTETTTETQTTVYPYISVSTAAPVSDPSLTESSSVWAVHEDAGTITYTVSDASAQTVTVTTYNMAVSDYNSDDNVVMPKYPYVNVNPQSDMGTEKIISGDGAVLYGQNVDDNNLKYLDSNSQQQYYPAAKTMAAKIYYDKIQQDSSAENYSRRYTTFANSEIPTSANSTGTDNTILEYMKHKVGDDGDRISTYYNEKGLLSDPLDDVDDFAVVVIANNDSTETTNLINRYIQLVTNTSTDYTQKSDYYDFAVNKCSYDSTTHEFNIIPSGAGLSLTQATAATPYVFQLNDTNADSLTSANTFTLIDVQFKDPFNTDNIAYHLYVPVYTIRQIQVTFSVAVKSATNSVSSQTVNGVTTVTNEYESLMSPLQNNNIRTHVDSLQSWVTHYIRYSYDPIDINALLNDNNVNWNHRKNVIFKTQSGGGAYRIPDDTYMVLVDPNGNSDREYYAKASDFTTHTYSDSGTDRQGWIIDLTHFKRGNDYFSVSNLKDVIARSLESTTPENEPKYYIAGTSDDYDVYLINSAGTPQYFKYQADGNGTYKLAVKSGVTEINEDYYISMYVPKVQGYNDELYYYTVIPPSTLLGQKAANVIEHNKYNVIVGELFNQTTTNGLIVAPELQQITATNHKICVTAKTAISFKNAEAATHFVAANSSLYHSFNISLNRYEDSGMSNDIIGLLNPNNTKRVVAKYAIGQECTSSTTLVSGENNVTDDNIELEGNYLNIVTAEIASALNDARAHDRPLIVSCYVEMDFDEAKLEAEFPQRASESNIGVNVAATSNLEYDRSRLAFSSIQENLPENNKYYYRESVNAAILNYFEPDELDQYEKYGRMSQNQTRLGVNGFCSDETNMPIVTQASYNVAALSSLDINSAESVRLSITLSKKTDTVVNGQVTKAEYVPVNDLTDYLNPSVLITAGDNYTTPVEGGDPVIGVTHNIEDGHDSLEITVPRSQCKYDGDRNVFEFGIGYSVITGPDFHDYANYKVTLKVEMLDGTNKVIGNSTATSYIVYTNAKVYPTAFTSE